MSLLEQQNFLAKLYTDAQIRRDFLSEPKIIGRKYLLNDTEIQELIEIFPDEIEVFAESLFHKRLREVEKLLPMILEEMGDEFEKNFENFTRNFIPKTIKKHLEDASEFCKFLSKQKDLSELTLEIVKFESAKLDFYGYGKKLVVKSFWFDVKSKQKLIRKRMRIWIRFGNKEYFI